MSGRDLPARRELPAVDDSEVVDATLVEEAPPRTERPPRDPYSLDHEIEVEADGVLTAQRMREALQVQGLDGARDQGVPDGTVFVVHAGLLVRLDRATVKFKDGWF